MLEIVAACNRHETTKSVSDAVKPGGLVVVQVGHHQPAVSLGSADSPDAR
jgi:hypothetical protein